MNCLVYPASREKEFWEKEEDRAILVIVYYLDQGVCNFKKIDKPKKICCALDMSDKSYCNSTGICWY